MSASLPDRADFADWIGRASERRDVLTPRLAAEFETTLAPYLARVEGAAPGLFWALAPDIAPMRDLGGDGHPRTGIFLPALPFPRRMWAGGELTFREPIRVGDEVVKTSVIEDIAFKNGASGPLGFVVVRHAYAVRGRRAIEERQDLVYRPVNAASAASPRPGAPAGGVARHWQVAADPVLLARYSAVTFNGHRIHYDAPYATGVEGYAGLVVHGPLQATLMLNVAAEVLGRLPQKFRYRGLAPLICGAPFRVEALKGADGGLTTRIVSEAGVVTMAGSAETQ
jgi:3-methylfumaryl-CoA hydratase